MTRLMATASMLALFSSPAWAIGGYDQAPISTKQAQEQAQQQSIHNVTKVIVNQPAASDPPAAKAAAATPAADPASDPKAHSGNGWHGGHGYSGSSGNTTITAQPALGLALAPSSGTGCGSEGIGAGGAGPAAGGLLSYTWEAPNCTAMQYAQMLDNMGHRAAALYVLNGASDQVHQALVWEAQHQTLPPQPVIAQAPVEPFIDSFCRVNPFACD